MLPVELAMTAASPSARARPKPRACNYGRSQAEDYDDAMVPGADTLAIEPLGSGKTKFQNSS